MNAWVTVLRGRAAPVWATALLSAGLVACGGAEPGDLLGEPIPPTAVAATAAPQGAVLAAASAPAAAVAAGAVDTPRPRIVQAPHDTDATDGSVAEFSVRAEGPRGLTYQWSRDGEPIDGAIGVQLQLRVTEADHLAKFSVEVGAGKATLRSDAATLRMKPP